MFFPWSVRRRQRGKVIAQVFAGMPCEVKAGNLTRSGLIQLGCPTACGLGSFAVVGVVVNGDDDALADEIREIVGVQGIPRTGDAHEGD